VRLDLAFIVIIGAALFADIEFFDSKYSAAAARLFLEVMRHLLPSG
jgi:hypothetical protein